MRVDKVAMVRIVSSKSKSGSVSRKIRLTGVSENDGQIGTL